jgi:hypothetical protein
LIDDFKSVASESNAWTWTLNEYCGQFHQHFPRGFFEKKLCVRVQLFGINIFGLYFFGTRILAQNLLLHCWWNWHLLRNFLLFNLFDHLSSEFRLSETLIDFLVTKVMTSRFDEISSLLSQLFHNFSILLEVILNLKKQIFFPEDPDYLVS